MDSPSSTSRQRPRWLLHAGWLLLAVLLAAGAWRLMRHPAQPVAAGPAGVPATTVQVASETVPIARSGVGTVLPVASVTVRTRVDGQLDSVEFKEGQDVKAGQVLVRIDPRTFQAQLEQLVAQKAKDEATLANARADLQRYGELIKEDATTQQTLDTQRALVNQLQASLKSDEAQIHLAQVQLGFTTIAAPISGRIGARLVDPGNIVHAADVNGLLVINQIDPIAVQFTLPESSFQAVNKALNGSHEPLAVEAIDRDTRDVLATGKLVLLNNQIDTATGTISLKAQFANAGHALWPGQSVDARVVLGERADALTVPSAVVQRNQEGFFAYVVGPDDKVRAQPLTVADTVKGKSVIETGLAAGDRVVLDGQYRLTPGARIVEKAAVVPVASSGAKP
ncbi:efflux RND transporter periplasmic adaptor subunit [Variovorax ginsengisoli]|uniref:Efflux RND transporter periplasmic adaptor subunit n=1 Tax=Variovorax ginsengisoli TaxID=363844 RepID=A0ABT8S6B4_9BURK|nr:efflux RND transporter periplasmic adaptor subunit [Variovorax ginsengisoli]MDN8615296.1 efflux RND transporter periplasmic adaptor subunit [Variovorax ginsengisoli]MDO1534466.1 efflux RND transporter periplasmic adaptor subunit [Variovorax ginsengisoli]